MGNVNTWAIIVKNILIPYLFIMFHSFKKIWKGLCISFPFCVYPSFYFCHPCGTVSLHADTILREHGVHQCLKCLVVVKARKPRLEQSRLCSCHWGVTLKFPCHSLSHWFIFCSQERLQTPTSIWVLPK